MGERADLKITVYHKSSIIDEFIGRAVINVGELGQDSNNAFTKYAFFIQKKADYLILTGFNLDGIN